MDMREAKRLLAEAREDLLQAQRLDNAAERVRSRAMENLRKALGQVGPAGQPEKPPMVRIGPGGDFSRDIYE